MSRLPVDMNSHRIHELRSLAMHRIVSQRLSTSPQEVLRHGLESLDRWRRQGVDCEDFDIWQDLLMQHSERLREVLEGESEEAVRLRQSSPFAGLVPESDRLEILRSIT